MTFDVTLEPDAELVVIVLDDHQVLRANRGESVKDVVLNETFQELEEEDEKLFRILRNFSANLLMLLE